MWLRNCWYVIACDHEAGRRVEGDLHARGAGRADHFYRKEDGGLVAMEDRCCHCLASLCKGRREGDSFAATTMASSSTRRCVHRGSWHSDHRREGAGEDLSGRAEQLVGVRADGRRGEGRPTEAIYQAMVAAFHEDIDMISAQHRIIQLDSTRPMLPLAFDAGVVRFRRLLEQTVRAEQASDAVHEVAAA